MYSPLDFLSQSRSIAFAVTASFAVTVSGISQRPTPTDRQDAIMLLQGTSPTPTIEPARITDIERWLVKIRKAHPEVAEIHQRMGHSAGLASVILQPEAKKQLEEVAEPKIVDGVWETGIQELDKLGAELGVRIGHGPAEGMLSIGFDKEYDVIAVCRRYEALAEVKHACANPFPGDGDEIFLRRSGAKLNFVFKQSSGPSHHFYYFEVNPVAGTLEKHGEFKPGATGNGRIHLWGVPPRFPTTPFADFDAVLKAADHEDWWVALHGLEVMGRILSGVDEPQYGEEDGLNLKRFYRVRDGLKKNEKAAYEVLLRGLEHEQHQLRVRALWHFQNISKLYHTGDADGLRAWKTWVADGAGAPE